MVPRGREVWRHSLRRQRRARKISSNSCVNVFQTKASGERELKCEAPCAHFDLAVEKRILALRVVPEQRPVYAKS